MPSADGLFRFFMRRVLPAEPAKFVQLDATGSCLLIFGLRVVPILTLAALQCDDFAHLTP